MVDDDDDTRRLVNADFRQRFNLAWRKALSASSVRQIIFSVDYHIDLRVKDALQIAVEEDADVSSDNQT